LNDEVDALAIRPNGDLLVGGRFTSAGGIPASRIARWNGASWSTVGSGMNDAVRAIAVMPNGNVVAGGAFTVAGGVPSAYWAQWTGNGIPWVAAQPEPQSVTEGATVTVAAAVAEGFAFDGPVMAEWRRNGTPIADGTSGASAGGGSVSGATAALDALTTLVTLTITGAKPSDSGQYTVRFTNACGNAVSLAAVVDVASDCPADLNGDGVVDGGDLGLLLGAWGPCPGCPADLNRDGVVNGADLGELLASWGFSCP